MTKAQLYGAVTQWFEANMPEPSTELHYDSPFHLLLAVILSAQCTDKRVNQHTPQLFQAYPTPQALAQATPQEIYPYIKSITYPNNKARSLIKAAQTLCSQFNGQMPSTIDELLQLPGVGRKTANVILAVVWGKAAMAVDTHVFRVSNRLGLTNNSKTPLQTEKTLTQYFPSHILPKAHHWLILHGRYTCKARKPLCSQCGLSTICRYYKEQKTN